jgi:hypothetical protein
MPLGCAVSGCSAVRYSRGYCRSHYYRLMRHGSPTAGRVSPGQAEEFFLETVIPYKRDDCLIWPFATFSGRGMLWRDGRNIAVARLVCEATSGPAPSPIHQAAHSCGQGHRGCVNPMHLSWKTPVENAADKVAHQTQSKGTNHGRSKLTENQVREIRSLPSTTSSRSIAPKYGVSHAAISLIRRGRNWAWLATEAPES